MTPFTAVPAGLTYARQLFIDETEERQAIIDGANEVLLRGTDPKIALDNMVRKQQAIRDAYFGQ